MWTRRVIVLALGIGLLLALAACAQQNEDDDQPAPAAVAALPPGVVQLTPAQQAVAGVKVAAARLQPLPEVLSLPATVEAPTGASARVEAPVAGYLWPPAGGLPGLGSRAHRGQILAGVQATYSSAQRIQIGVSLRAAKAAAASAREGLAVAEAEASRSQALYKKGIAPLKQVQQDQAAVAAARAALAADWAQYREYRQALTGGAGPSRYPLRAPIAGHITAVGAAPGELVQPGQVIYTIVNETQIWAAAAVPEADIALARGAPRATLTLAAYPGRRFAFRRIASTGVVNSASHTLTLIYGAANTGATLKPGMAGTLELRSRRRTPTLTVPRPALLDSPGGAAVFVAVGAGRFRRQPVTVAYVTGGAAAIAAGLQAGQRVVVAGAAWLESDLRRASIEEQD